MDQPGSSYQGGKGKSQLPAALGRYILRPGAGPELSPIIGRSDAEGSVRKRSISGEEEKIGAGVSPIEGGYGYGYGYEGGDEEGEYEDSGSGEEEGGGSPLQKPPEHWLGVEGTSSIPHGYDFDKAGPIPSQLALPGATDWDGRETKEYMWWPGLRVGETSGGARSLPSLKSVFGDEEWRLEEARDRDRNWEAFRSGSAPVLEGDGDGSKGKGKRGAEEEERSVRKSKSSGKISIACEFCRARKLKCSGERPKCLQCVRRGQSGLCVYAEKPKRRGPGKAPKGSKRRGSSSAIK